MASVNSTYTTGRPLSEVRLRNWPAGKVAQLKRAVELLEGQLNETMAAQVDQGSKAVFSSRVPSITGLNIVAGFKNFQITFNEAKGIDNLLFYEIQQDTNASFPDPTIYRIPQTTLTIPTTAEHQQIYIRVRCQNAKFEVGPWSATEHATGSSNFRITVARQSRFTHRMDLTNLDTWESCAAITYTPTAASTCIHIHAGIAVRTLLDTDTQSNANAIDYFMYAKAKFRVLRNGVELTNAGTMILSTNSEYVMKDNGVNIGPIKARQERTVFGTIILPFETFVGNETSIIYTLQAQLDSTSTTTSKVSGTPAVTPIQTFGAVDVLVDCFDTMEVIQST